MDEGVMISLELNVIILKACLRTEALTHFNVPLLL